MRIVFLLSASLFVCSIGLAQSNSPSSHAAAPASRTGDSLPQDRHEGVSIAADPYTEPAKTKDKFGKADPLPAGILAVELFLRNETSNPIQINLNTIQLDVRVGGGRLQGLDWLTPGEAANLIAHPKGPRAPRQPRFPIGVPSENDSKTQKLLEIIKPLALDADIIPPMGTIHGFLFFNLENEMSLAESASLYVPDAAIATTKKPLMFFEVPLGKASAAGSP